ncbi:hypothetical protein SAMN04488102_10752 [Alkalibacterium subtropicum]|uniref:Uncharacterized protein n=1 Tax=Alkalibacterium subtropicum TaxID=753702 RepID=A0A1I1JCC7_9LACT|nr:hypothetical protein [Alkalibacterium subtropicum]SFC45642.1 hypothetical protein SAMN04488102_10752 [Alkalibacterium subtropicum]
MTLTELLEERPWAREYLYFDPDLNETGVVYAANLEKFAFFLDAMEDVRANSREILTRYKLPDYKEVIELLAVFKVTTLRGPATLEQQELFFDMLSAHIKTETDKGRTREDIFEDKDAIALARLYQVSDPEWSAKYLTWILFELGAISKEKGPDVFGANASAFQTYDFLKEASNGKWRPQMQFSE